MVARCRAVRPDMLADDNVVEEEEKLGLPLMLAYIGLACAADANGVFPWHPGILKAVAMPHHRVDFGACLRALEKLDKVRRFEDGDGSPYGVIKLWGREQTPVASERPQYPPPPEGLVPPSARRRIRPHGDQDRISRPHSKTASQDNLISDPGSVIRDPGSPPSPSRGRESADPDPHQGLIRDLRAVLSAARKPCAPRDQEVMVQAAAVGDGERLLALVEDALERGADFPVAYASRCLASAGHFLPPSAQVFYDRRRRRLEPGRPSAFDPPAPPLEEPEAPEEDAPPPDLREVLRPIDGGKDPQRPAVPLSPPGPAPDDHDASERRRMGLRAIADVLDGKGGVA